VRLGSINQKSGWLPEQQRVVLDKLIHEKNIGQRITAERRTKFAPHIIYLLLFTGNN
jgi:hypothetical protein